MDFMSHPPSPSSTVKCSICMDDVTGECDRTVVKLRCAHMFHLDCIGSAFNVKGIMECPNCREIENGIWRCFENGSLGPEPDDVMDNEEVTVEFIDMGTHGTFISRRHRDLETGILSPGYGNFIDPHVFFASSHRNTSQQLNDPPVPNYSQIDWRFGPRLCDGCITNSYSRADRPGGSNWASVPSATLSARADFLGMPNEPYIPPRLVEHGFRVHATVGSPFGLAYQGSNDPLYPSFQRVQQPPTRIPSPVARALRRSNGWS